MGQFLANLATRHHLALLYLRADNEPPIDEDLKSRCGLVEEIRRPTVEVSTVSRWRHLLHLLAGMIRGRPMWVTEWAVPAFGQRARAMVHAWRPDIIQIEYHIMAQYLGTLKDYPAPHVLVDYEPGSSAARDRLQSQHGLQWLVAYLDLSAWERYERDVGREVQAVVVFTGRDLQTVTQSLSNVPIIQIPFGTPIPEHPLDPLGKLPPSLLFVGNFMHSPNTDAALRLIHSIFPQVQTRYHDLQLYIVGENPPTEILHMRNDHINVTGRVAEVTPYLDRATIVVVPLRLGGGMRVKVLEALAAGKVVIASPRAVEGLDVVDQEQIILAEHDHEFVAAIDQMLASPERRAILAAQARAWACMHLGWEHSIDAYDELYKRLASM